MFETMFMAAYTAALPLVLTGIMGYVGWQMKKQKTDREAQTRGIMLLLRVELIAYHHKYMDLGEIPSYAYASFIDMYNAYHALGGNGMVTKIKEEIDELRFK